MTTQYHLKSNFFLIFISALTLFISCNDDSKKVPADDDTQWTHLIDKNLSSWDTYLSFKHKVGYDGSAPLDSTGTAIQPIGFNKPGYDVFSTTIQNDDVIIQVSGEYYGCLVTKKEYENYHLQVQYKWGDKKWVPRLDKMKDSGILYHSVGDFGVEHWRSWMMSQEFQIMEAHTGDFWSQANSAIDIRAYDSESGLNPMAHESQDFLSFGKNGEAGNYCLRSNNYEKSGDEWNTLELICFKGKSLHVVNGEVVMILKNSRYINENGQTVPLTKGKIQLQTEAAEIFFKEIKIKTLEKLTEKQASYFN